MDSRTAGTEPPTKHFVGTGYTVIGALLEVTAIVLMRLLCVRSHLNLKLQNLIRGDPKDLKWLITQSWL